MDYLCQIILHYMPLRTTMWFIHKSVIFSESCDENFFISGTCIVDSAVYAKVCKIQGRVKLLLMKLSMLRLPNSTPKVFLKFNKLIICCWIHVSTE